MKYNIFRTNKTGKMVIEEFEYEQPKENGFKMPMAHCDQKVLHAPKVCQFCDHYPEAQALRQWWGINYTGEHDPGKSPCPSTHTRTDETRDLWYGNRAEGYSVHDLRIEDSNES